MRINHNRLHDAHLWVDLGIGAIAIIGLLVRDVLEAFYAIDLAFHVVIFVLATGVILAERLLHGGGHKSKVFGGGTLHRGHLIADLSISAMAVAGLLFADVLSLFFEADIVFHIAIVVLALGSVVLEKVFHKHSGIIAS